jgi:pimeloyl-ACP methyl ester carboxylesterase
MKPQTTSTAPSAAPSAALLALEGRAWLEASWLLPALPALARAPRGDGHPVLVLPGFLARDRSTFALRRFLRDRGYYAHGWRLGRNLGPSPDMVGRLVERFDAVHRRHGRSVSLIGWSLGGIYARELARAFPGKVRLVITLASPLRDLAATNVARLARLGLGPRVPSPPEGLGDRLAAPLEVPCTSFYSESDGIVSWRCCVAASGPSSESLVVRSSHCGMGHHPTVLLAIADRLAQPEGGWRPFVPRASSWWPFAPTVAASPE